MKKIYLIIVIIFVAMNCFGQTKNEILTIEKDGFSTIEKYVGDVKVSFPNYYRLTKKYVCRGCSEYYYSHADSVNNKLAFNVGVYCFSRCDIFSGWEVFPGSFYYWDVAPHKGKITYNSNEYDFDEASNLCEYIKNNKNKFQEKFSCIINNIYATNKGFYGENKTYHVVLIITYPSWEKVLEKKLNEELENAKQENNKKQEEKNTRMQSLIL